MPKLDTAKRLGLGVHAPERTHVPSQTLADSPQYSRSGLLDRGRFRQGLRNRVLHAEAFLCALALGDVAGDLGGADDPAGRVPERRHGQRDIEQAAILAHPHRLVGFDALAAPGALENPQLFVVAVRRDDDLNGLADDFTRLIAKEPFGRAVPTQDGAIEVLADDRVLRGIYDGCQPLSDHLGLLALRQVEHESDTLIPAFLEGRRADQHGNAAAVFPEVLLL